MVYSGTQPDDNAGIPINSLYRKEDNTFPAMQSEPGGYLDSFSNQSTAPVMSFFRPLIAQKAHSFTGSSSKTINCTFTNNNITGNSIVIALGMGEVEATNITLTITDTNNNVYTQAVKASQSTTLEAAIFYAVNIASGANTITATIAGSSAVNAAIAIQIYECWGLIGLAGTLDQTSTGSNAGSTSPSTGAIVPTIPNELCFAVLASGGGTITAGSNFNLDSGSLLPQGGGIVSFGSQSQALTSIASITPSATLSASNAWAMATATFRSVAVPVSGTVTANAGTGSFTVAQTTGSNLHTVVDSGSITATTNADTTIGGTSAPSKELLVAGKTNDGTPQYQPIPEGAGGRSVIVEGYSGGTAVPVSGTITSNIGTTNGLALDSSVNGVLVSQGSTTSGEKGPLIQGAVTTSSPSYTTAQTSPLSLTTAGALRTDGSAVTQPVNLAVGTALTPYGSNPTQTAAAGADTQYKFGASGTTSFNHISGQNNTAANVYLAFDQSTTVSGNQVYLIAPGQAFVFDRAGTILHFSSPAQQSFGGLSGITVEAFA